MSGSGEARHSARLGSPANPYGKRSQFHRVEQPVLRP
jgi:hypothetical protein